MVQDIDRRTGLEGGLYGEYSNYAPKAPVIIVPESDALFVSTAKKEINEDNLGVVYITPYELAVNGVQQARIAFIADGVGSGQNPHFASAIFRDSVISNVAELIATPTQDEAIELSLNIFSAAEKDIRDSNQYQCDTTAVLAINTAEGGIHISHSGDSRAYVIELQDNGDYRLVPKTIDDNVATVAVQQAKNMDDLKDLMHRANGFILPEIRQHAYDYLERVLAQVGSFENLLAILPQLTEAIKEAHIRYVKHLYLIKDKFKAPRAFIWPHRKLNSVPVENSPLALSLPDGLEILTPDPLTVETIFYMTAGVGNTICTFSDCGATHIYITPEEVASRHIIATVLFTDGITDNLTLRELSYLLSLCKGKDGAFKLERFISLAVEFASMVTVKHDDKSGVGLPVAAR